MIRRQQGVTMIEFLVIAAALGGFTLALSSLYKFVFKGHALIEETHQANDLISDLNLALFKDDSCTCNILRPNGNMPLILTPVTFKQQATPAPVITYKNIRYFGPSCSGGMPAAVTTTSKLPYKLWVKNLELKNFVPSGTYNHTADLVVTYEKTTGGQLTFKKRLGLNTSTDASVPPVVTINGCGFSETKSGPNNLSCRLISQVNATPATVLSCFANERRVACWTNNGDHIFDFVLNGCKPRNTFANVTLFVNCCLLY